MKEGIDARTRAPPLRHQGEATKKKQQQNAVGGCVSSVGRAFTSHPPRRRAAWTTDRERRWHSTEAPPTRPPHTAPAPCRSHKRQEDCAPGRGGDEEAPSAFRDGQPSQGRVVQDGEDHPVPRIPCPHQVFFTRVGCVCGLVAFRRLAIIRERYTTVIKLANEKEGI